MSAVAENYAEALFELAGNAGQLEEYGRWITATARALEGSPTAQAALVSPKVTKAFKAGLMAATLERAGAPAEFVRYLLAVGRRGRQGALGKIAEAYGALMDRHHNRVRASVVVARAPDPALEEAITASLGSLLGQQVVATFSVDPEILGGAVVRVGDRVYDGSVRRRLVRLKQQLLGR